MPDWSAVLISPDEDFDGAPLLRTELRLDEGHGAVERATLLATAHGVFEAFLNGRRVGDDVLSPGWSSYEWRLRYNEHDVTALLDRTSVPRAGARPRARQRLVPRAARLGRRARLLRRRARGVRPAGDHLRRRSRADRRDRRVLDGRPLGRARQRPLRRRDDRRPPSATTAGCGPATPTRPGSACTAASWTSPRSRRTSARPCERVLEVAPVQDLDLPVRTHPRRLRPEPRRLAAGARPGTGRHDGHPAPRRGARARRARRPSAADGASPPTRSC